MATLLRIETKPNCISSEKYIAQKYLKFTRILLLLKKEKIIKIYIIIDSDFVQVNRNLQHFP